MRFQHHRSLRGCLSARLSGRGIRRAKDGQNILILPLPAAFSRVFAASCGRAKEGAFSVEKREL